MTDEPLQITEKGRALIESGLSTRHLHELETGCTAERLCERCVRDALVSAEAMIAARDRRIEELQAQLAAAQRPPLGYVVLSRNPDSGRLQPQGRVHTTTELAQDWRRHLETPGAPRIPPRPGTTYILGEVREVQP